jgi:DNA-binding beta-propeller fold protein YncE
MDTPRAVATDAANNVYLADRVNSRVQKFDSSGNFLRAWGKDVDSAAGNGFEICTVAANCQPGDPAGGLGGEMNFPQGIATDATGSVYLADSSIERIQKFDASGNFLSAWGKDVDSVATGNGFEICTVAANCQAGATGGLGGEMDLPTGVATDAAGNVYLGDRFNNRIQRFAEPLPAVPPAGGAAPTGAAAPTGQRAAALKKCKKKAKKKHWTKKQLKKCKRNASKLPV